MNIIKRIKNHFSEVLKIKTSPNEIALGFAIGTFIAILPTPGLSILIGLLITLMFPRLSKLALFGAFFVWNPLIVVPINLMGVKIGNVLFADIPATSFKIEFFNIIYNFTKRYFVGNLFIAVGLAIISYFIIILILKRKKAEG